MAFVFLLLVALVGCSSEPDAAPAASAPARLCTPGSYVFCRCADSSPGTRLCKQGGDAFEECVCEQDPLGGGEGGSGGESGAAGAGASPGDACPGVSVALGPGEGQIVPGTTVGATDDTTAPCGGEGPDVVYRVLPQVTGVVTVKVKGEPPLDPVVYASKGVCGASGGQCINASGQGGLEGFSLPVEAGEEFFVVVDSEGVGGAFAMTLSVLPTVEGDGCPGAAVQLAAGADVVVSGDTTSARSDFVGLGACAAAGDTGDVAYAITPKASGVLTASLTPGASFDGVLYARSGACADGTQVGCADNAGPGAAEQLAVAVKQGEPLTLLVDGKQKSVGPYSLKLHLDLGTAAVCGNKIAEPGEQCDDGNQASDDGCSPGCLTEHNPSFADCPGLSVHVFDQPVLISGGTALYANYDGGSCGGGGAKDRFYAITPHTTGTLKVSVVNASFDPVLYARSGNCPTGKELACVAAPGATLDVPAVAGETFWLAVDGADGQSGTFTLSLSPP